MSRIQAGMGDLLASVHILGEDGELAEDSDGAVATMPLAVSRRSKFFCSCGVLAMILSASLVKRVRLR